jgi:hypothetical protein
LGIISIRQNAQNQAKKFVYFDESENTARLGCQHSQTSRPPQVYIFKLLKRKGGDLTPHFLMEYNLSGLTVNHIGIAMDGPRPPHAHIFSNSLMVARLQCVPIDVIYQVASHSSLLLYYVVDDVPACGVPVVGLHIMGGSVMPTC